MKRILLAAPIALLAACGGDDGNNGTDGRTALVSVTSVSATIGCTNGGSRIDVGLDLNGNGILEPSEVQSTSYVCNGTPGTGSDGDDGTDGLMALVALSNEAPGANCSNGGTRIDAGIDSNRNNILDADEIQSTSYACNGDGTLLTPSTISLSFAGRYSTGIYLASAAEIVAYHPATQQAFVVNAQAGAVDVLDISNVAAPTYLDTLTVDDITVGAVVNSVAVSGNLMAFAVEAPVKTDDGFVAIYNARTLARLAVVAVGAQPDMLTFTPNGRYILVANEGEPSDDYSVDPEGSVSIIDITDFSVRTADFNAWDGQEDALRAAGVRIFGPGATTSQDLEPEYVAVSSDSSTAWVSLQENNALAKIDIASATVIDILPMGFKDHGLSDNGFGSSNAMDASDTPVAIDIRTYPGVLGMYQPDSIASYEVNGQTYIVTANEGDARAWGETNPDYWGDSLNGGDPSLGFVEEIRVTHLINPAGWGGRRGNDLPPQLDALVGGLANGALLNPTVFGYCGAVAGNPGSCRNNGVLGRLTVTWVDGYQKHPDGSPVMYNAAGELDPAGDRIMYDALYAFGGRSISIFDADGNLVWDSGDQMEQYLASDECMAGSARNIPCKDYFNSNHSAANSRDNRSDNKGPEPEGIAIGKLGEKTFAFVGLERMGGVMAYDVTDPANPFFVDYLNTREVWDVAPGTILSTVGDLGAEGVAFVAAKDSPNGEALLLIGNEVSGTTSIYQVNQLFD
jgi:DNA-binding beta-propeller fold protein YncE